MKVEAKLSGADILSATVKRIITAKNAITTFLWSFRFSIFCIRLDVVLGGVSGAASFRYLLF
jgi:hypothetical protein